MLRRSPGQGQTPHPAIARGKACITSRQRRRAGCPRMTRTLQQLLPAQPFSNHRLQPSDLYSRPNAARQLPSPDCRLADRLRSATSYGFNSLTGWRKYTSRPILWSEAIRSVLVRGRMRESRYAFALFLLFPQQGGRRRGDNSGRCQLQSATHTGRHGQARVIML